MKILITYDVSTADKGGAKRLRRVARACQDFGQRVQKSVFECSVGPVDWVRLRGRLTDEIDREKDSLRIDHLAADTEVEHVGSGAPQDLDGPLVV